ncbi:MAG: hypothetical protein KGL37_01205, partial [Acidobacteriota bacterium]|nr:hypothetical protein [Acidobacteriota bacterium]
MTHSAHTGVRGGGRIFGFPLEGFGLFTSLLLALAASAAIIAGCGGGHSSTVLPNANTPVTGQKPAATGHRIMFYSRDYYKAHPELLQSHGPHARALHLDATNNLVWGGGPVQHSPKLYLIFWGWSSASDTSRDPDGLASYLVNYANAYGGSNLANVQTQYNDGSGYITNPHPMYGGAVYDSSLPPSTYTDAQVASEALKYVS